MMLKVNGQYLDFNGDIEIEKKIKLFEDIETTDGDVSFAFDVELTSHNISALGIPFPDSSSKNVYTIQETEVLNNEGQRINSGSIKIERIIGRFASCSFFGGNSNWFAMLTGNMTELRLSQYDTDINENNISSSWTNEKGIIFPLIDTGSLITRGYLNAVSEDFVGCFYAHTLLKETFQQCGLKIQGELLDDPFFKTLIIGTNTRSKTDVNNNSLYVGRYTDEVIGAGTDYLVQFDEQSTPFYVGSDVVMVSDEEFYFSADMVIEIVVTNENNAGGTSKLVPFIYINGVIKTIFIRSSVVFGSNNGVTTTYLLRVEKSDYLSVRILNSFGFSITMTEATLKITPRFIYKTFGRSSVPLWTKQQFVSNVFALFNTLISYDPFTKTVTVNLFEKIKEKPPIDLSDYLSDTEIDYSEFISNYGRVNNFTFEDGNDPDLLEYNISGFLKYGQGTINIDNDFVEQTANVVDSEFSIPVSYINPAFNASLERIEYVDLEELQEVDITSVSNSGGIPRFDITNADDFFETGNLVRLLTTSEDYNGDFVIVTVTSSYIEVRGLDYTANATGTAVEVVHTLSTDDNVYIFSVIRSTDTNDIFDRNSIFLDDVAKTSFSIAFFNLLRLGREIESTYKQGLSFGRVNDPLFFQRTLLERYWTQFGRVLNDPVKAISSGDIPFKIYNQIDFLSPVYIKTLETSNLYYVNKISGYNNSYTPCEIELIKLP